MNTEILTVGDTHCVRPFDDVEAEASRLLGGPLPFDQEPLEVPNQLRSESVTPASLQDDSVRARLANTARQERKRRHLLKVLQGPIPPWSPSDHPELDAEGGAATWVKKLRREAEQSFEKRTRAKEQG
jgi:hypothetical protein